MTLSHTEYVFFFCLTSASPDYSGIVSFVVFINIQLFIGLFIIIIMYILDTSVFICIYMERTRKIR